MSDVMIYSTLAREVDSQKLARAIQIDGGFFTCESVPTGTHWQEGQLCYVAGSVNKFYQYKGSVWGELDGFGTSGEGGITPKFQLNGVNLEVSYDDGNTWSSLGRVKGVDGTNGTNGVDGTPGAPGTPGENGTSVTITSITNNTEPGGSNYVHFSTGDILEVKNGLNGQDGAAGSGSVSSILKSIGITKYKVKALSNGQKFKIEPGTLVIVSGDKYTQTLVDASGNRLKDSKGNTISQFSDGMFFNTDVDGEYNGDDSITSDGQNLNNFRSMMMLGVSQLGGVSTTITSRNYNATKDNTYILAGSTEYSTWIFYTELQQDQDTDTHAFTDVDYGIYFTNRNGKNTIAISGDTSSGTQGGNITLRSPAQNNTIDLWSKTAATSRIIVKAESDTDANMHRTTVGVGEVTINKEGKSRSLSTVLPWGYSLKIVSKASEATDANTIYLVTGT